MGAKTLLKRSQTLVQKPCSSEIGKKVIDEEINYAPELYRLGTSKIRNKNVRRALNSDVANYNVQKTQKKAKEDLNNLFGGL